MKFHNDIKCRKFLFSFTSLRWKIKAFLFIKMHMSFITNRSKILLCSFLNYCEAENNDSRVEVTTSWEKITKNKSSCWKKNSFSITFVCINCNKWLSFHPIIMKKEMKKQKAENSRRNNINLKASLRTFMRNWWNYNQRKIERLRDSETKTRVEGKFPINRLIVQEKSEHETQIKSDVQNISKQNASTQWRWGFLKYFHIIQICERENWKACATDSTLPFDTTQSTKINNEKLFPFHQPEVLLNIPLALSSSFEKTKSKKEYSCNSSSISKVLSQFLCWMFRMWAFWAEKYLKTFSLMKQSNIESSKNIETYR